jgi:hypothetical protein
MLPQWVDASAAAGSFVSEERCVWHGPLWSSIDASVALQVWEAV